MPAAEIDRPLALEPLIAAKAKQQQIRKPKSVVQISAQQKIITRKEVAKLAGLSHDTIAKVKFIQREAIIILDAH